MRHETGSFGGATGWARRGDLAGFSPLPGVRMDVYSGTRMMLNFYTIAPGATIGWHSHPHEQIGTILAGEIHLRVGAEEAEPWVLRKGDVYVIAPDVPHTGTAGRRAWTRWTSSPRRARTTWRTRRRVGTAPRRRT